jgi:hypothetical protein
LVSLSRATGAAFKIIAATPPRAARSECRALTRLIPLLPDKMAPADTNIEESAGGMPLRRASSQNNSLFSSDCADPAVLHL